MVGRLWDKKQRTSIVLTSAKKVVLMNLEIESHRQEIVELLTNTKLSYTQIGKKFGVSMGPIGMIKRDEGISRPDIRKKPLRTCKICHKEFSHKGKSRPNRGKFCSKDCYTIWQKSEENKGVQHPNWIDGGKHETELNRLRKTDQWRIWREAVYKRDNYTCQMCGKVGERLNPHHIFKKSHYPELVFDVSNGITLCELCHKMTVGVEHKYVEKFLGILGCNEATYMYRSYFR